MNKLRPVTLLISMFIFLAGCSNSMMTDRPVDTPPAPKPDAMLLAGPWFTATDGKKITVCYITDIPVYGGANLKGPDYNTVRRAGTRRRFHRLDFETLSPGTRYQCKLLIERGPSPTISIKTFAGEEGDGRIAFINCTTDTEIMRQSLREARKLNPDAVVLSGLPVDPTQDENVWEEKFFAPLANEIRGLTLLHMPEPQLISSGLGSYIFPGLNLQSSYAVDAGALKLLFVTPEELSENQRFRLLHWMRQTLINTERRTRAVVLPSPLLTSGKGGIHTRLLGGLAPFFEESGVGLALSTRGSYYHRTVPVGTAEHGTFYVTMPATGGTSELPEATAYTGAQSPAEGIFLAATIRGELNLRFVPLTPEGNTDTVARHLANSAILNREELVTSAWAEVVQKKELQAIARQACQALVNPAKPDGIRILVTNPSPKPFIGKLNWIFAKRAFYVKPEEITFNLEPGEAMSSLFNLEASGEASEMPELVVTGADGFSARQAMLLTWQKTIAIPHTDAPYRVDGKGDEDFWDNAASAGEFVTLTGKEAPAGHTIAWLIAGPEGLRVRFKGSLPKDKKPAANITTPDGPVWQDESVEIFIDPEGKGRVYYQLSCNTAGVTLDSSQRQGRSWNPEWQQAVEVRKGRYNVEFLIPYTAFGLSAPPAAGSTWGINLTRNDYTEGTCTVYQTAPTHGPNSRSGCYVKATFR